jgi:hypothetical protein
MSFNTSSVVRVTIGNIIRANANDPDNAENDFIGTTTKV